MMADGDGLYLEVVPGGQKYWWYISQAGDRKKFSIGKRPDLSLNKVRESEKS
nr:Arm DNA-binding domain-containing protein [Synergistes jonesii]